MALNVEKTTYLVLFSDFLSIITILIATILKVPQIFKILQLKNARGINLLALLMELFSYTVMMSYNFRNGYAILSYLEYPIILIQELILIFLVLKYKNLLNIYSLLGSGVYVSLAGGFLLGIVPLGLLAFLVPLCTPIGASSKVVQLYEILRMKNAQSVSVLTWFISAFTNFTRLFTITLDSADLTLLLNFAINTVLSTSVTMAAIYYKTPSQTAVAKKTK
ncbi:hypothetical protein ABEB36_001048 [Hypothenemus hampei]|uniref:Solute carrier family 66 member 3 n=1 Tax=Hypothenemus hampei TaxID=57062 RepID=A0ABD1FDA1_HYPHA